MLGGSEHEHARSPIDAATQKMLKEKIDQALSVLTGLEREVIKLRYGISDEYTYTLDVVAGQFGLTPGRVRDIESRALDILRSRQTQT